MSRRSPAAAASRARASAAAAAEAGITSRDLLSSGGGGRELLSAGSFAQLLQKWLRERLPVGTRFDSARIQKALSAQPQLRSFTEHLLLHTQGCRTKSREMRVALRAAGLSADRDALAEQAADRLDGRLLELQHLIREEQKAGEVVRSRFRDTRMRLRSVSEDVWEERSRVARYRGQCHSGGGTCTAAADAGAALRQMVSRLRNAAECGSVDSSVHLSTTETLHRLREEVVSGCTDVGPSTAAGFGDEVMRSVCEHNTVAAEQLARCSARAEAEVGAAASPVRIATDSVRESVAAARRAHVLSFAEESRVRAKAAELRQEAAALSADLPEAADAQLTWEAKAAAAAAELRSLRTAAAELQKLASGASCVHEVRELDGTQEAVGGRRRAIESLIAAVRRSAAEPCDLRPHTVPALTPEDRERLGDDHDACVRALGALAESRQGTEADEGGRRSGRGPASSVRARVAGAWRPPSPQASVTEPGGESLAAAARVAAEALEELQRVRSVGQGTAAVVDEAHASLDDCRGSLSAVLDAVRERVDPPPAATLPV
eukprot:TRINITY_DN10601_c3_g1_i1.p1 TRINITY_DN10601_c3_g1~~TRINITY_DN10601_c3_g1_i1.p1  ORF type:complete len:548 (+),score=142.34 TRINITY_DN10601_c3_g1_i1:79-1722(+)